MKVTTTYTAYDGTNFKSEEECLQYESEMLKKVGPILGLNGEEEVLTMADGGRFFEESEFIYIKDKNILEVAKNEFYEWGYSYEGLHAPGYYLYDACECKWVLPKA